jgi:hypothetical protein
MKKANALPHLIAWLGVVFFGIFASKPVIAGSPVRFKQLHGHLIIVPVSINGAGPFDFIFDTAASATIIDCEIAKQLSLHSAKAVSIKGGAATKVLSCYRIAILSVGPKSVENLTAPSAELREIHLISPKIGGVLGQDFLSRFNYILNYRDQRIEFEERGEFENNLLGARLSVDRDRGRVIIDVQPSPARRQASPFVLDSGAARMVLFKPALGDFEVVMDRGVDGIAYGSTVLGKQMVATGRLERVRVGDENLRDVRVRIMESPQAMEGRPEHGLLPTSLFRSIYFDNKADHVILNPVVQNSSN